MKNLGQTISLFLAILVTLMACGSPTATPQNLAAAATPAPLPRPRPTPTRLTATCADLDAYWGQNWPAALDTLEQLIAAGQNCGDESLLSKKYAAHFIYGDSLERDNRPEPAIAQYQAALTIDPQRREALDALIRLKALPRPTPPACLSNSPPRPDPAPAEPPDPARFVTAQGSQLRWQGQPFIAHGVNYYPRRAPWYRFLTEADPDEMAAELDLIKQAGFNTLRIFLWYEPLFTCQPEEAIPNEPAFATVDRLVELARQRDLKLIVTLNDLPDLFFRPLYTDWEHYDNQTIYIVRRYRNEPAILAWDLRNEGDLNHGAENPADAYFSQPEVIDWLAHISQIVKENDPHHLLTAGWWGDPLPTEPYVDILSFHHWSDAGQLQERIKTYQQQSDKPLMLQEVGYHTWSDTPDSAPAEQQQADSFNSVIAAAEAQRLAGWVIWTAFDFAPAPGQSPHPEHFFGLWRVDLTPKPALEALPLQP